METNPFLEEVLLHPDDDAPRLIYADWLEEQGDPRGEFIRVQCALAKTSRLDPPYFDLLQRNEELLSEHRTEWAAELDQDLRKAEFHRGFVDTVTIRARAFDETAKSLFRRTPVHWVRFNYLKGVGAELAESVALGHIRSLNLGGLQIPSDDLLALLSSPHLNRLQELDLSFQGVALTEQLGQRLGSLPCAESLRSLNLLQQNDSSQFFRTLARTAVFPELEKLSIGQDYTENLSFRFHDQFAARLRSLTIRWGRSASDLRGLYPLPLNLLHELDMHGIPINEAGMELLVNGGALGEIRSLKLGNCQLPLGAIRQMCQGRQLRDLRHLDLSAPNQLFEVGQMRPAITLLAQHEPLAGLRELCLGHLCQGELEILASSGLFTGLQSLDVTHVRLTDADARAIVEGQMFRQLRSLVIKSATIDSDAMRTLCGDEYPELLRLELGKGWTAEALLDEASVVAMVESRAFPGLRILNLDFSELSPATLIAIAERSHFPELRRLEFNGNRVDNDSVRAVLNSSHLPKLRCLSVQNCGGLKSRKKMLEEFGGRLKA